MIALNVHIKMFSQGLMIYHLTRCECTGTICVTKSETEICLFQQGMFSFRYVYYGDRECHLYIQLSHTEGGHSLAQSYGLTESLSG